MGGRIGTHAPSRSRSCRLCHGFVDWPTRGSDYTQDLRGAVSSQIPPTAATLTGVVAAEAGKTCFCSNAKSKSRENSNIDIGISGHEKIDPLVMMRIKEEIKGIPTLKKVDVVDFKNSDDSFVSEVLKYAREL